MDYKNLISALGLAAAALSGCARRAHMNNMVMHESKFDLQKAKTK